MSTSIDLGTSKGPVFVSFAQADAALGRLVRDLLVSASVPRARIVFTGDRSTGVPTGSAVKEHLRTRFREAALVIQLLTPTYAWRQFCLVELGAQWVLGAESFPLRTPAVPVEELGFLGDVHVSSIADPHALWELHGRLRARLDLELPPRDWAEAQETFLTQLPDVLTGLPSAPVVARAEHERGVLAARDYNESQLRDARRLLRLFTEQSLDDCREREIYEYFIGETRAGDAVRFAFNTSAVEAPVVARPFEVGATPFRGAIQGPTDFESARFRFLQSSAGREPFLVPAVEGPDVRRIRGLVGFSPSIQPGESFEWGFEMVWPGMWDRLRMTGEDTHEVVLEGTRASHVELRLHFADDAGNYEISTPPFGQTQRSGQMYSWEADDPRSGEHVFRIVRADP